MSSFFEGWYFKHQKGPETLALIAGRAREGAFLQVLTQEGACRAEYPLSAYQKGPGRLRIGDSVFTPEGLSLSVHQNGVELSGSLRYGRLTPIRGDIMGPFRFFPMQCRHTVVSMEHPVSGVVLLGGRELDLTGGKGYLEGDSGRSFPKSYTWVQCSAFDRDCSIMASAAHIPFAGTQFWGCICVVLLEGVEYRLATYRGARILRRDAEQLVLAQRDLTLCVRFLEPRQGHLLAAPQRGEMVRGIREAPGAPARFEFRKGGRILFQAESQFASCEYVDAAENSIEERSPLHEDTTP